MVLGHGFVYFNDSSTEQRVLRELSDSSWFSTFAFSLPTSHLRQTPYTEAAYLSECNEEAHF